MPDEGIVLLADDEETFRHSAAEQLRREGFRCDTAADGAETLTRIRSGSYDVLVTDLRVAGSDGLEPVRRIPQVAPGLAVVIATGSPSLESAIEAVHLQVAGYLVKPLDFGELVRTVRHAATGRRVQRAVEGVRARLHELPADLEQLAGARGPAARAAATIPLDAFLDVAARSVMLSVEHLRSVAGALAGSEKLDASACEELRCPVRQDLIAAVRETIAVLEKTKSSFKSRQLAELRVRLEALLPG